MEFDILFEEVQGSGKKSVEEFFKVTSLLFMVALVFNLVWQTGKINQLTTSLFVGFVVFSLIYLFVSAKMITQIRQDGICVRFPPFQPSFNKYLWNDIEELYLREFDALSEYNGWGIKVGSAGKGYIISGDKGIQILLRDKSKVLIGTGQPGEVARILSDLKKKLK
jgi:hypothetical protein